MYEAVAVLVFSFSYEPKAANSFVERLMEDRTDKTDKSVILDLYPFLISMIDHFSNYAFSKMSAFTSIAFLHFSSRFGT